MRRFPDSCMEYGLVVRWLAVFLALGLAGAPLAALCFRRFPDRGAALALPLSLAVVGCVAYWVGHLSLIAGLVAGVAVLVGLSTIALRRLDRNEIGVRRALAPAAVFALAFLFMIAVRAVDPAVHPGGGEKFLDFGLLKSLSRTSQLPPEDFWFAGESVQYYYGGHLLTTLLAKLTLTEARYAYNLALAGFYAMVVTAAYGLAGAIAAERGRSARTAGVIAAFLVGFASNLETTGRAVLWALPDGATESVAAWLGVGIEGLAASPAAFSYWDASRVIPAESFIIPTEFPLFAWLNGDLHAHMLSTPFLLLAAACWFAYYRAPADAVWRRRLLAFGAVPPLAGLLAVVNTWSFPTIAGIGWLAMTFADSDPRGLFPQQITARLPTAGTAGVGREVVRTATALVAAAVVLALGVVWSLPFWLGSASGRAVAFLPERSALGPLLLVYGAFVLVFVPYLAAHARSLSSRTREAVLAALAGLVAIAWLADAAAVAVFGPLLLAGWLVLAARRNADRTVTRPSSAGARGRPTESDGGTAEAHNSATVSDVGYETVLLVAGAGLVLLVEFVYIQENAGPGRFNTVFKTYAQIWILFATAAGAMAAWLVDARPTGVAGAMAGRWRVAGRALLAGVVLSTSIYGGLALTDQFTSEGATAQVDDPTLDARAFVPATHPDEAAAIAWLDDRSGQPHIASLPGCWCNDDPRKPYRWVNAPSSLTGLPTVAGWGHETGYRGTEPYRERVADVETIYEGNPEEQARLLAEYDVEYVYVGPNERAAYEGITVAGLRGVEVARQFEGVTIYRVDQAELPS
jgi:YYY domain-containing protein